MFVGAQELQSFPGSVRQRVFDLAHQPKGQIDCFCNLGNKSHLLVFANGLNPIGMVSVKYHGHGSIQYLCIESATHSVCLRGPNIGGVDNTSRFEKDSLRSQVLNLETGTFAHVFTTDQIDVSVRVGDIDHLRDRRNHRRVAIAYLKLEFFVILKQ